MASSFECESLIDIVRYHHAYFMGTGLGEPQGQDIPLGARIVTICDAYDAMITDRVYRPGRSQETAFAELRRMGGMQFDPELVERFIEVVSQRAKPLTSSTLPISRELALNLGLQTERLASAIDDRDFATISAIAAHLQATAKAHGLSNLAEASELLQSSAGDRDLAQLIEVVHEISGLSLLAQQVHLAVDQDAADVAQARCQPAGAL